jgi:hypothetical protein
MTDDTLTSLGIPGSIEITGATTQDGHSNEAMDFQHVEPVDEEERMEDAAWALELECQSKLDPHTGNILTPEKPEGTFRLRWGNL